MTREQASLIVLGIRAAFSPPNWEQPTVDLWIAKLMALDDYDAARKAAENVIDNSTAFAPRFASFREEYLAVRSQRQFDEARARGLPEPELSPEEIAENGRLARELSDHITEAIERRSDA